MERISILVPTWKRSRFLPLLLRNLKIQDYPHHLLEVVILDDCPEEPLIKDSELEEVKKHLHPIKLNYIKDKERKTIGKKRNLLVKHATSNIVAYLDDDDIYFPTYISYSYDTLKNNKLGCVGSNKMIFAMSDFNYDVFAIDCGDNKKLIHEATIMMTKKWFRVSCGFGDNSQGEGKSLFFGMERSVAITDIRNVMCCLQHRWNTVEKTQFATPEKKIDMQMDDNLKKILDKIIKDN